MGKIALDEHVLLDRGATSIAGAHFSARSSSGRGWRDVGERPLAARKREHLCWSPANWLPPYQGNEARMRVAHAAGAGREQA